MLRRILQSFLLALQNIRSNFFHTILSVLGIVIGVAALVSILSLIDGMEELARAQITSTTSLNAIGIKTNTQRNLNGVQLARDTFSIIDYPRFLDLKNGLTKPVTGLYRASLSGEATLPGDSLLVGVNAWTTNSRIQTDTSKVIGELYTEEDVKNKRQVVVVNTVFVETTHIKNDSSLIGKILLFNGKELKIIGITTELRIKTPQIYFPITLLSNDELRSRPPDLYLVAEKTEDIPQLKIEIEKYLDKNFKEANVNFTIQTNDYRIEQATKAFLLFKVVMGLIVGISVIVGGIGVMNVLLISVTERTAEIGVRKAMGANRLDITLLFLSESTTVSAFGSMLGLIFGTLGTMVIIPIVRAITEVPFQASYSWNTFFVISIIAILVGIIFGTYPAIRASKLDPVDAIRHE